MKILLFFQKYLQKPANNPKNMTLLEAKFLILILENKKSELLTFIDECSGHQENINVCLEAFRFPPEHHQQPGYKMFYPLQKKRPYNKNHNDEDTLL